MSYYHNNDRPWDDGVYGTGHTQPPKSHIGLIALLLILLIFLSGLVTVLGIMNIRLSRKLSQQESEDMSIAFAAERPESVAEAPEAQSEDALVFSLLPEPTETAAPKETEQPMALNQVPETEPTVSATGELALQEIYEKCIPTVVSISCTLRGGSSTGTGVILSEKGYVVTNYHVIENAAAITVQLSDDRTAAAGVVGSDPASDLAVLMIEADGLTAADFGSSDSLRVGDTVVAIGDPLGVKYRGTMTNGIVSAINRNVNVNGRMMNLIQTNAALNSGNSGGPLINSYGQVIGINTMKIGSFTDSAGVEGLGFAIPSATVKDIVDQIITQGYVSGRPRLGIQGESISIFYQRYYRLPSGMYITEVDSGSRAEEAGIQPGDILISLDNQRIYSMDELTTLLYNYSAGDTVTLLIYRSGYQYEIQVVLQEARG